MPQIFIRTDGSEFVGTGHIMRCLTLAKELIKNGKSVVFICNKTSKKAVEILISNNIEVVFLPENIPPAQPEKIFTTDICQLDAKATKNIIENHGGSADCLIIDHYGINAAWEKILRPAARKIMVIDDLANRQHDCDILLDQNYYINPEHRYDGLLPDSCIKLLGPAYALLREEFRSIPPVHFHEKVENILVSFGGSDPDNFTAKILELLTKDAYKNISINVVMGNSSTHKDEIEAICKQHSNLNFHCQINYMARLMSEADLFIGAGGSTSWERLAMGLPSIVIAIAENQMEVCENLAKSNLIIYCGSKKEFSLENFSNKLDNAISDPILRKNIAENGKKLVDVMGVEKVVKLV